MEESLKWNIYIIFHKVIYPELYEKDSKFKKCKNYIFLKTEGYNPKNEVELLNHYRQKGYNILEEKELPFYDKTLQPSKYHAPSAIYHLYKNKTYKNLDYIGFMEYDMELSLANEPSVSVTDLIQRLIKQYSMILLSCRHHYRNLEKQSDITIDGKLWIDVILQDYNEFFHTSHKKIDLYSINPIMGAQQSFICDKETFEKLGSFLEYLIEKKEKRTRIYSPRPSTLFERYVMIFMHFVPSQVKLNFNHVSLGKKLGYAN